MDEYYYHLKTNQMLWRYCWPTTVFGLMCLLMTLNTKTVDASLQKSHAFLLFHEPPKPLDVWLRPVTVANDFPRPTAWQTKSFGQWCRNVTINRHIQCPEASPFHWFVCCGKHNTECCVGIQTWAYVVFGTPLLVALLFLGFYLSLQLNLLCPVVNVATNGESDASSINAKEMKIKKAKRMTSATERFFSDDCSGDAPLSPSTAALLRYSSCGAVTATVSTSAAESSPHSSSSSASSITGDGSSSSITGTAALRH